MDDTPDDCAGNSPKPLAALKDFVQRFRIPLAVAVCTLSPLARYLFDSIYTPAAGMTASYILTVSSVQTILLLSALIALCWPWADYSVAARLSLTGAITIVCAGSAGMLMRMGFDPRFVPWIFPIGAVMGGMALWLLLYTLLYTATFVRMRFWPLYPPGHCIQCDYDLTGNVSGTCPECGKALADDHGANARL